MSLQMRETHLDPFALIARFEERLGLHLASSHIARIFVNVARHITRRLLRAALGSQWAGIALALQGSVTKPLIGMHGSAGPELLAIGANVDAASSIPFEVG